MGKSKRSLPPGIVDRLGRRLWTTTGERLEGIVLHGARLDATIEGWCPECVYTLVGASTWIVVRTIAESIYTYGSGRRSGESVYAQALSEAMGQNPKVWYPTKRVCCYDCNGNGCRPFEVLLTAKREQSNEHANVSR